MKLTYRFTLALCGLSLALLQGDGALASQANTSQHPLSNAHLDARHPSALCGRGKHQQQAYVDLYAPFTPSEIRKIEGYRGIDGGLLSSEIADR